MNDKKTNLYSDVRNCFCPSYHTDKQAASSNSDLSAIKYRFNLYICFFRNLQMKSLIVRHKKSKEIVMHNNLHKKILNNLYLKQ
jgi:hypothetical protein